jgi:oligopeptidase B
MTNQDAENFKMMETPVANPSKENWSVVIPHRDSATIDSLEVFREHLVIYEQDRGLKRLRVLNLVSDETHYVEFPEPIYSFWPGANLDFNTNQLRFIYTSFTMPSSVFHYDMDDRTRELKKQYEVEGGYDPSAYQSERIFAEAEDGTKVPISLVYRKGLERDGSNPAYMVGYGGYGDSYDPYFSRVRLSLLERDFVYAIAHVRGGGEMGQRWHEQGRFLKKMNTFTDFIACAEHLIAEGYTSSEKLVISGGSAGGLLMGAAMNLRPDLFAAVIAGVPQVDVLNTLLDPSIPLTVSTYGELGNPYEKEYYDYIKAYSPYDNVGAKDYPHILITNGLNDPRVQYYVAAKWAAKLRAMKTDENILLLTTNMSAGHMGSSGRYDYLREIAFEFAFILELLGIGE